jgi:hypothetical protein
MNLMNIIKLILSSVLLYCTALQVGCVETPITPVTSRYGVSGKVYGTNGKIISDAKIYCTYFMPYIPTGQHFSNSITKLSGKTDFPFQLFQSFPNPCSHSFYLRFSLPEECTVVFTIRSKRSGQQVYQKEEKYPYGLFQIYFRNIVDTLQLYNGIYQYRLTAFGKSGNVYQDARSFLVTNNSGPSNSTSDSRGYYFFDVSDASIGDTIRVADESFSYTYPWILDEHIYLLVIKDGYEAKFIPVDLLPHSVLTQDIVLRKSQ